MIIILNKENKIYLRIIKRILKCVYINGKLGIFDKELIIEDFENSFNKVIKNILNLLIWITTLEKGKKNSDSK